MIRFPGDPVPPLSKGDVREGVQLVVNGGGVVIGYYNRRFEDALFDLSELGKDATAKDIARATRIGMRSIWIDDGNLEMK